MNLHQQLVDLGATDGTWLDGLVNEYEATLGDALPWFRSLSEPRRAVLTCIAFDAGAAWLRAFDDLLNSVRDERYEHAAEVLRRSGWGHQRPRTTARLAMQIATGEWQ